MGKVRVYELARELGMEDSKPLMRILRDMGYKVKTASSGLPSDAVKKIKEVVAPHIEAARKEAEEKERRKEEAKKAAHKVKVAKPARAVRVVRRPTEEQKQALLDRHRRKMEGEVPVESASEVMQTNRVRLVKPVAKEEPPAPEPVVEQPTPEVDPEKTVEMAAVESAEPPVETKAPEPEPVKAQQPRFIVRKVQEATVEMPAVRERAPELSVRKVRSAPQSEVDAARQRELPPDQAIAAKYRQRPNSPPPASSVKPDPEKKTGERKGVKKGGRTREIQQKSRTPRRQNFQSHRPGARKKKRRKYRTEAKVEVKKSIEIPEMISVGDLAGRMDVPASDVIKFLLKQGQMCTINQGLEYDRAASIIEAYGFEVAEAEDELPDLELLEDEVDENLQDRPPVITVLGHVDHGKTSLLDAIRSTNVTEGEAGGITQRIGAYSVKRPDGYLTFIDTPGHEAFTQMRARGAQVTDVAILVVAADDGVMPQTIEAISHVKAAKVPIIVAMNKIDKADANPDRLMQQLAEYELVVEAWGGDTPCVKVSAVTGEGIEELLEMITLVAEIQELQANPERPAEGIIIESGLDKGLGPVATVLVKNGTLKVGDTIVVGDTWGRVRGLLNEDRNRIDDAGPSFPAEIVGLSSIPEAGDRLQVVDDEKMARQVSEARTEKSRRTRINAGSRTTLEDLFANAAQGEQQELRLLVKAEGHGSVEALTQSLKKLSTDEVKVDIVHSAVGAISESDVMLASASDAILIGFNVRPTTAVKRLADQEQVEMRLYTVIYHVLEEVKKAMAGLLAPDIQQVELGKAEIREVFKISKVGKVAGAYVIEGKIVRDAKIRLVREGILIYEGKLSSLRRFKDDVREVAEGFECGFTIENYNEIQEGDVIEAYREEAIARESI